jgi:hypothetical protein
VIKQASTPLGALPYLASAASRNQSSKPYFTTEARSSQSSEYFLIKNSLLRALGFSAVSSLLDRYNQLWIAAWMARAT